MRRTRREIEVRGGQEEREKCEEDKKEINMQLCKKKINMNGL